MTPTKKPRLLVTRLGAYQWKQRSPTVMVGRFMLDRTLMNVTAVKVRIVDRAYIEPINLGDMNYVRMAHELMANPGMPETVQMFGGHWIVLMHPAPETR